MKFRGKDVVSKYWVYGELKKVNGKYKIHDEKENKDIPVDISTLGQFTGFYDIDGREIYVGDCIYPTEDYLDRLTLDKRLILWPYSNIGEPVVWNIDLRRPEVRDIPLRNYRSDAYPNQLLVKIIGNIYDK